MKLFVFLFLLTNTVYANPLDRVDSIIGEIPIFSGPNCHNTSLRALGLMQEIRYIHRYEMDHFLKDQCEPVESSVGALGVIFRKGYPEAYHSFVVLEDGEVLTKDGASKRAEPKRASLDEVIELHTDAIKTHCRVRDLETCEIDVRYFGCSEKKMRFSKLADAWEELTRERKSFFEPLNQERFLKSFSEVAITESETCAEKKGVLQSYKLSALLASQSKRGLREQEIADAFLEEIEKLYQSFPCEPRFYDFFE